MNTVYPRATSALVWETVIVLGCTLGKSGWYSLLNIVNRLTAGPPLSEQTTTMNASTTPDRPWLDFVYELSDNLFPFFWPAVALYLLWRVRPDPGAPFRSIGLDATRVGRDLLQGLAVAVCVIGPALGWYLLARRLGWSTHLVMGALADVWWAIPMYVLAAFMNGFLEEVLMIGYLFSRWSRAGWNRWAIVVTSALVRGSYHLYQGFGGFASNLVFGLLLGWFYLRQRRLWVLVIGHAMIDVIAFVGYSLVSPLVDWL